MYQNGHGRQFACHCGGILTMSRQTLASALRAGSKCAYLPSFERAEAGASSRAGRQVCAGRAACGFASMEEKLMVMSVARAGRPADLPAARVPALRHAAARPPGRPLLLQGLKPYLPVHRPVPFTDHNHPARPAVACGQSGWPGNTQGCMHACLVHLGTATCFQLGACTLHLGDVGPLRRLRLVELQMCDRRATRQRSRMRRPWRTSRA